MEKNKVLENNGEENLIGLNSLKSIKNTKELNKLLEGGAITQELYNMKLKDLYTKVNKKTSKANIISLVIISLIFGFGHFGFVEALFISLATFWVVRKIVSSENKNNYIKGSDDKKGNNISIIWIIVVPFIFFVILVLGLILWT